MTCRHGPGDTDCSSHPMNAYRRESEAHAQREAELKARTPDPDHFEIQEVEEVNGHLVLKVKYQNLARCSDCSFEGSKLMVFLNCNLKQAIKWRRIDPHFKDAKKNANQLAAHAPAPAARFPASAEGWKDALDYAARKK
jgi:hypothetical protein